MDNVVEIPERIRAVWVSRDEAGNSVVSVSAVPSRVRIVDLRNRTRELLTILDSMASLMDLGHKSFGAGDLLALRTAIAGFCECAVPILEEDVL